MIAITITYILVIGYIKYQPNACSNAIIYNFYYLWNVKSKTVKNMILSFFQKTL